MCPYNNNYITKDNLSTQTGTPKGQELLGHIKKEWKKMMAVFFFIAHEKGFKFHAQPQTGAYSCEHVNAFSFFFLRPMAMQLHCNFSQENNFASYLSL